MTYTKEDKTESIHTQTLPTQPINQVAENSSEVTEILQSAFQAQRAHRLKEAEQQYRRILEKYPDHSEALYGLGILMQQKGEFQTSEHLLNAALQIQPNCVKTWFSLGNLRLTQEQFQEAIIAYRQAIALQPNSPQIYNNLGYTLEKQRLFDEAIYYYRTALDLKPDFIEAEVNLYNALHTQGKISSEKTLYYGQLNNKLGDARKNAGDMKMAVAYYKQAIAMQPDLVEAHDNLGFVLQEQGELEEAITCYQTSLALDSNYAKSYYNLGKAYQQKKQLQEAGAAYRQWLTLINPHYARSVEDDRDDETTRGIPVITPPIPQTEVIVGGYPFPGIPSVSDPNKTRPFWSVVIPVYNRTDYVLECLANILAQWSGEEEMEILVMDNASQTPVFEIVNSIGKGVVRYYRNTENVGCIRNMNAGIALSRGQWIHVIPDDDYILPGFYSQLKQSLEECSESIGAAFTGYENVNEKGKRIGLKQVYGEYKGVAQNWLWKIGVTNPLNMSAVVIRRLAHERLGSYLPELSFTPDWELYKRISTFYDWWCESNVLAGYRVHGQTITGELVSSGTGVRSFREAINLSEKYLPADHCAEITAKARSWYFNKSLELVTILVKNSNIVGALCVMQEALQLDGCSQAVAKLFALLAHEEAAALREEIASRLLSIPVYNIQNSIDTESKHL